MPKQSTKPAYLSRLDSATWHEVEVNNFQIGFDSPPSEGWKLITHAAATGRSKKRPRHVIQALRRANLGRKATEETRPKIGEASRSSGARPPKAGRPWTPEEDSLLAQFPVKTVAEKTGRTLQAMYDRRHELGMPDGRGMGSFCIAGHDP